MSTTTRAGFTYGAAEIASTSSPTSSSSMLRARSAWVTMPTSSVPSMTGRRRTACSFIVLSASLIESSAPIVTVSPSPPPRAPPFTAGGAFPPAAAPTRGGVLSPGLPPPPDGVVRPHALEPARLPADRQRADFELGQLLVHV